MWLRICAVFLRGSSMDLPWLFRAPFAFRFDDLDDLRDDLAALFDQHDIADHHAEPLDVVFVVQRCARDRGAGKQDGFKLCDRR